MNHSSAPGRVNLIGEHTDYNDGYVLPIALDRGVTVAFRSRNDRIIRARSTIDGSTHEIALDRLDESRGAGWVAYVAAVAWAMEREGCRLAGADLEISSTLAAGAGLSSSAALEVAVYRAFAHVSGVAWNAVQAAKTARHAENQFVGVACGVMDQMASACSREGHATLIDCRTLDTEFVAMPASAAIVVIDTGVRRTLSASDYNERRSACERAVAQIRKSATGVHALRDVTQPQINALLHTLGGVEWQRASHVVAENARVLAAVRALRNGDLATLGALFTASHESLRDLYEVSSRELDAVVEWSVEQSMCFGARLTGAGFGGCAIALVDVHGVDAFIHAARRSLPSAVPQLGDIFVARAGAGASIVAA